MSDDLIELEEDLNKLGARLRQGWAKMHSVNAKEQAAVLQVVREQWEKEQKLQQARAESKEQAPQKTISRPEGVKHPTSEKTRKNQHLNSPEQDRSQER